MSDLERQELLDPGIARDFVRAFLGDDKAVDRDKPPIMRLGTVTAIDAPTRTVSITVGGEAVSSTGWHYLNGYAPTVGDVVVLVWMGPDAWVLGKLDILSDPAWINFTGTGVGGFSNGWVSFSASPSAGYRRVGTHVYLRGGLLNTDATQAVSGKVMATLPLGYRPSGPVRRSSLFIQGGVNGWGRVDINTSGQIIWQSLANGPAASRDYVGLDTIDFEVV